MQCTQDYNMVSAESKSRSSVVMTRDTGVYLFQGGHRGDTDHAFLAWRVCFESNDPSPSR